MMMKYAPIQLKEKRFYDMIGFDVFIKTFWIFASKVDVLKMIETVLKPKLQAYQQQLVSLVKEIPYADEETPGVIQIYDFNEQNESRSALNLQSAMSLFVLNFTYQHFEETMRQQAQSKLLKQTVQEAADFCFNTAQKI